MDWMVFAGVALKIVSALIPILASVTGTTDMVHASPLALSGFMAGSAMTSAGQKKAVDTNTQVTIAAAPAEKQGFLKRTANIIPST